MTLTKILASLAITAFILTSLGIASVTSHECPFSKTTQCESEQYSHLTHFLNFIATILILAYITFFSSLVRAQSSTIPIFNNKNFLPHHQKIPTLFSKLFRKGILNKKDP